MCNIRLASPRSREMVGVADSSYYDSIDRRLRWWLAIDLGQLRDDRLVNAPSPVRVW